LVHSYAALLDDGNIDGVVALFDNATWRSDVSTTVRRGASEIRPVYEQLLAAIAPGGSRHLITNLTVVIEPGAQQGSSRCYWTVLQARPTANIDISLSGQYFDTFVKVAGEWRFSDRLITTDRAAKPR
jgi:3-phenylpropionate/cinnamic acid dioxygenase small subunit